MEVCRCFLIKKMSVDNLYRAAILGHLHDDEILKDAAMQKLVKSSKSVKGIQGWKELKKYPELAFEMFEFYYVPNAWFITVNSSLFESIDETFKQGLINKKPYNH